LSEVSVGGWALILFSSLVATEVKVVQQQSAPKQQPKQKTGNTHSEQTMHVTGCSHLDTVAGDANAKL
jgi:hypothetical protein